ncbi:MAG: M4 family metallopeptidase [Candidatus Cloacimonetes bacterium]|nr:M4 family metallopeptidase [Candidatus Cloacimonadota bacterium]
MTNIKKLVVGVIGLGLVSSSFATDHNKGYELMSKDLGFNKIGLNLKNHLTELNSFEDKDGNTFVNYQKKANGYKVYGETKTILFPKSDRFSNYLAPVRGLSENEVSFMRDHDEDLAETDTVKLTESRAYTIAVQNLRSNKQLLHESLPSHLAKSGDLVMYRDVYDEYKLVYNLTLPGIHDGLKTSYEFFIEANTGEIVDKIRTTYSVEGHGVDLTDGHTHTFDVEKSGGNFIMKDTARQLNVYNSSKGRHSSDADGTWDSEGTSRKTNQKAEVELYLNMARVIDYFKDTFNIIWKDGRDDVHATAHVRTNFNNAYYSSWQGGFFFGDGSGDAKGFDYLTKGLDVAGHEFTHGVIDIYMPLTYSGESGALNEHIADVFGAMVDDKDWQMGDNITIGDKPALRNMKDPARGNSHLFVEGNTYDDWRKMMKDNNLKASIYPDRVKSKIICSSGQDNGGVHLNSSIFNKFVYLISTGNEIEGDGLGRKLVANIYMRMMKAKMLSRRASFIDFRDKFLVAADLELEGNGDKDALMTTVKNAFARIDL